ncbi:MAG: hypothetical protein LBS11_04455 [Oscillospiraceae bacterium]|jgi:hypothetical protein|nr:hypothetical protein [Oscillospiraceae bacterium]
MGEGDLLTDCVVRQLDSECAAQEHCFFDWNGSQAVYRNRLTACEGINALSAQRLGNAATGLQLGLMQCSSGAPTLPPVIRVFPSWKKDWDAEFELRVRGGFIVRAKMRRGVIEYVSIEATRDADLKLINPWGCSVSVDDGRQASIEIGAKLMRSMKAGDMVTYMKA